MPSSPDRVFPSKLIDVSALSLAELGTNDEPALQEALRNVGAAVHESSGPLLGDSQSEEMSAYARRPAPPSADPEP